MLQAASQLGENPDQPAVTACHIFYNDQNARSTAVCRAELSPAAGYKGLDTARSLPWAGLEAWQDNRHNSNLCWPDPGHRQLGVTWLRGTHQTEASPGRGPEGRRSTTSSRQALG